MAFPRSLAGAVLTSLLLGAVGGVWEALSFGLNDEATARRLEAEVRDEMTRRAATVQSLAERAAEARTLIGSAAASPESQGALFTHLSALAAEATPPSSVTVYVPGPMRDYDVLAWTGGASERIATDRLTGASALFVARGTAGLHLVYVEPIEGPEGRLAVVAAETVLSAVSEVGASRLETSFGPVRIIPPFAGAGEDATQEHQFVISAPTGAPLLEVRFPSETLRERRHEFRRRVVLVAALPLALAVLPLVAAGLRRRREARSPAAGWRWSAVAVGGVAVVGAGLAALTRLVGAPVAVQQCLAGAATLAMTAVLVAPVWWRRGRRLVPSAAPTRFVAEQLLAGAMLAGVLHAVAAVVTWRTTPLALERWHVGFFPFDLLAVLDLVSGLLFEIAICWAAAVLLVAAAHRWRLRFPRPTALLALGLWMVPVAIMLTGPTLQQTPLPPEAVFTAFAFIAFAFSGHWIRRSYRQSTHSTQLLFGFLALFAPLATIYPMAASIIDRTRQHAIEHVYAPATVGHPEDLRAELARAQENVDRLWTTDPFLRTRLASLPEAALRQVDTQMAYLVWSQSTLSRRRATSGVEIYGADRSLLSRFALNVPEYLYRAAAQTWSGSGCDWDVFGEAIRFGAEDRLMLHAQRGLCDDAGTLLGAVVIHMAHSDYRALPFLPAASPSYDLVGVQGAQPLRAPDLDVVVYGWSLRPIFMSGRVAWPIVDDAFQRLYRDGGPFWTAIRGSDGTDQVYFSQDRQGIYAIGYRRPGVFEHAMRLAEIGALTALLFLGLQLGLAVYAPLAARRTAPVKLIYREIRTSFYRKLFLFFVLVAIVPVVLFAVAFGAYMTAKLRADVEFEATSTVTVARRVFEELTAVERPGQPPAQPSDDVMVWIRQVIGEDVNLYEGSTLLATSQRDLFDSGLLPTRTPASAYLAIALERMPVFVGEDRQGRFQYLVAAAPATSLSERAFLSVPLASRQREIERQIDELNRGVLVGSVLVVLFAAALGASIAGRVSDPVERLTKATRQIAAGRLDVRIAADTADELRRLVDDFNSMAATLLEQREELARANQLQAWNEMARQVAHEIKNPLTPVQLAAEHLQKVHEDRGRPLGAVFDHCLATILGQVRLLRQIASEFANFAGQPVARAELVDLRDAVHTVIDPYRTGLAARIHFVVDLPPDLPPVLADPTLLSRALTNVVENAVQAMPGGGALTVTGRAVASGVQLTVADTGVGMDAGAAARAFEPYFSTKTGGSGLGLANARRNIELGGGEIVLASAPGRGTTITITLPRAAAPPGDS